MFTRKKFTLWTGFDNRILISLQRDGVDEPFGSSPVVKFTIDGIVTYTNADGEGIEVADELGNAAIVHIAAGDTEDVTPGQYLAQCWVKLDAEDDQLVDEVIIEFRRKLAEVA